MTKEFVFRRPMRLESHQTGAARTSVRSDGFRAAVQPTIADDH
jgi:hypothetical protein